MYLALYESFSQTLLLHDWWASHWLLTVIVAGALGDACGSVLRLPAEMVRGSSSVLRLPAEMAAKMTRTRTLTLSYPYP